MLEAGDCSPGKIHKVYRMLKKFSRGQKNRTKRDADDDKRASVTMNEGERSSHAHLYGISRGFAETWGVRAETYVGYVQSTCGVRGRYAQNENEVMGPVNLEGVFIEERSKCFWCIIENYSKIQNIRFYKNFYSKNCRILNFFRYSVRVLWEEK